MSSDDDEAAVKADSLTGNQNDRYFRRRATPLGRVTSLDSIAAHYYERLLRFLKQRRVSREDAADLAQDTFLRLAAVDVGQIREPVSFLYTTALNLLRDRARSAYIRHALLVVPVEESELTCPAPHVERVLEGEQRMRALAEALRELNPKCRAVFVLFHFDGVPQKDIADRLGISVSMVEKYVKRAVRHCHKRLDEYRRLDELNGDSGDHGGYKP